MKILIADDHAIIRRGLKQIVCEEFPDAVFGEAQDGRGALDLARSEFWDLILLDITMRDLSGIDILQDLNLIRAETPVLIVSMHSEDQFALRVLKAGASGYVTKESAPEELIKAVHLVMSGKKYISSSLAEKLASLLTSGTTQQPHENLSLREFQIFRSIAAGRSLKEIAAELFLSIKTVSTYRTRLLKKMKLRSNADLVHYAWDKKLLE